MLLFAEYSHAAADRIHRAIVAGTRGEKRLVPTLRAYEPIGSTDDVWFETTKTCYETTKSHLNLVAQDSGWESKLAESSNTMPEVVAYAKNQGLNFKIPYTYEGRAANYVPDFLIRLRDPASTGPDDLLTLVLEVTGEAKKEKQAKVATAEHLWTVAVNNWGGLGPLGVPRGHRPVGRRAPDPGEVLRRSLDSADDRANRPCVWQSHARSRNSIRCVTSVRSAKVRRVSPSP